MKKFILILFAFVAILNFTELKATCPSGGGYTQQFVTITVNNCKYNVELCVFCGDLTRGPEVRVFGFSQIPEIPPCTQTWNYNQILTDIYRQVYDRNFLVNLCSLPGPCGGPYELWVTLDYEICWEKRLIDGKIYLTPCKLENCYCWALYKICWNGSSYDMTLMQGPASSCPGYDPPTAKCPNPFWTVPDPTPQNPISDCFWLTTPCQ